MTTTDVTQVKKLVAAELRRRKRRKYIVTFITGLITSMLLALLSGWYVMLAVGVARAEWVHDLPTIGYWWAVLLVYLLRGTFAVSTTRKKES